MARIRTVKPDLFRHEVLKQAEDDSGLPLRLAFIGLFCCCDREGRFEWRPMRLKLDVMPYDDIDFSRVLDALRTHGFVVRYECDGRHYGCIPTFGKHQVVNNREKDSILPPPSSDLQAVDFEDQLTGEDHEGDASSTRQVHAQAEGEGEGEYGMENNTPEDSSESSVMRCPHGEIIDAWSEVMPDKQQVRKNMWKSSRKEYGYLAARWKEMATTPHSKTGEPLYTTREEGIAWWKAFFQHIRKSEFLMDDKPWFTFGWVVAKSNFYKIIEGNYHQ